AEIPGPIPGQGGAGAYPNEEQLVGSAQYLDRLVDQGLGGRQGQPVQIVLEGRDVQVGDVLFVLEQLLFQQQFELGIALAAELFAHVQHRGGGDMGLGRQLPDLHVDDLFPVFGNVIVNRHLQRVQALDLLV